MLARHSRSTYQRRSIPVLAEKDTPNQCPSRLARVRETTTPTAMMNIETYHSQGTEATLLPVALQITTASAVSGLLIPVAMKNRSCFRS